MADPDDIIDPNDLDSIDALLDEAEFDLGEELEAVEPEPVVLPPEVAVADDIEQVPEVDDGLVEESELAVDMPIEQAAKVEESMLEEVAVAAVAGAAAASLLKPEAQQPTQRNEPPAETPIEKDPIEKILDDRQQNKNKSEITVEQMDSLKKIIIIFGSTSIVLILTAIGIGVWGAISASHAGISEETQTMLESMKVNGDTTNAGVKEMRTSLESVEKKLDAINFQVEQLATDLITLQGQPAKPQEMIDPLGLHKPAEHNPVEHNPPAVVQTPPIAAPATITTVVADPQILKKMDSINYRLIKAQQAMDAMSSQIKNIQQTQQEVVHGVKSVEKQQLLEMKERADLAAEKAEAEKAQQHKSKANPYSYQTPDGMFYDQRVQDSYP
ncbi:hypothetical protein THMIRHAS_08680 [Thiosulfatimonas sediminis]|uniref:Uncharacterized protein n=1 Tax=Thiosulfatimonas sediminis TaxID=2675054 RepID=A0A6F8PTP8_9GAMM|nr:hypothetical protein [Thiosulfatimonas sediminis]BBP45495.1 hypothetical protein THMIRHAS_08680 [Thiosulfatimonas sediminis]